MAYVRWHGIYAIKDGLVVDKIEYEKEKLPEYFQKLRNGEFNDFIKKYVDYNEILNTEEDMKLLQRSLLEFGKLRIKEETLKEEGILQAISTLQDLDIYTNFLFEHLSEWYGIYTLKTDRSVDDTISNIMENVETLISRTEYDKKALLSFSEFVKNA
ncbi:MAG: hypothetical protein QXZ12_02165, partial [Thermoplasmata archaeon]